MFINYIVEREFKIPKYRKKVDENGNFVFVMVDDSVDRSTYINSFSNSSSLASVLSRITYLPINEKISSLNMTSSSTDGDTSILPKDGTEAFILMKKYEKYLPDISSRLSNGESLSAILSSIFSPVQNSVKETDVNNVEN